eukprot:12959276-Alexandrium_andersonii.AAC.1
MRSGRLLSGRPMKATTSGTVEGFNCADACASFWARSFPLSAGRDASPSARMTWLRSSCAMASALPPAAAGVPDALNCTLERSARAEEG